MSRPYFNILAMTYSSPVLQMTYDFLKVRGGGVFTIGGLSQSFTYSETLSSQLGTYNTYSVNTLGTSASTQYTDPSSLSLVFSGTVSSVGTKSNVKISLQGTQVVNATASTTVLATYLTNIVNAVSFTGINAGFTVSAGTNSITIGVPTNTGNQFNTAVIAPTVTAGASSLALVSDGNATFSGGVNLYAMTLTHNVFGGYNSFTMSV